MPTPNSQLPTAESAEFLAELSEIYAAAIPLAQQIAAAELFDESSQSRFAQFQSLMQEVHVRDARLQTLIRQNHKTPAAAPLQPLLQHIAQQIQELMTLCDGMEKYLMRRRNTLVPQISHQVRLKQMETAYGGASR